MGKVIQDVVVVIYIVFIVAVFIYAMKHSDD